MTTPAEQKPALPDPQPEADNEWIQLKGFARSVAEVEFLLVVLAIGFLFFSSSVEGNRDYYIGIVTGFAVILLLMRYTPVFKTQRRLGLFVETVLMTVFVLALTMATNALDSPLLNLFLLPIITGALVLGKRSALAVVGCVVLCYTVLHLINPEASPWSLPWLAYLFSSVVPVLLIALLTILLAANIRNTQSKIRALSDRDGLTSLYNMRAFTRLMFDQHQSAQINDGIYSLLMIDIDNLKQINDKHGHESGNEAISLVSSAITRSTRGSDVAARYGGDEFIVLLPRADAEAAEHVMQRLRSSVYGTTLSVGSTMVRVTVSVGIATYPTDGADTKALMKAADAAMYDDKQMRRDTEARKRPKTWAEGS